MSIIVEFAGYGRLLSVYGKAEQWDNITFPRINYGTSTYYDGTNAAKRTIRIDDIPFTTTGNYKLVFGANEWQPEGNYSSSVGAQFRGEYIKIKLILPTNN